MHPNVCATECFGRIAEMTPPVEQDGDGGHQTGHCISCAVDYLFGHPLSLRRAIFLDLISGGGVFLLFSFVFLAAHPNSFLVFAVPPPS